MIPILPPELIYTILESTTLSHHTLTKVALTSRALLPSARKLLYRSIEMYYEVDIGYVLHDPNRPLPPDSFLLNRIRGQQIPTRKCDMALKTLRSNQLLPPLVRRVRITQEMLVCSSRNVDFVSEILRRCFNVEVLVCTHWRWHPKELEEVIADVNKTRSDAGQATLSVHLDICPHYSGWSGSPLKIALASLNPRKLDSRLVADFLASSTSSLQAIQTSLADVQHYQKYRNITTLFVRYDYTHPLEDVQRLLSLAESFSCLRILLATSSRNHPTLDALLWLVANLPSTLRSLSLEYGFSTKAAVSLADALSSDTCFRHLNLSNFTKDADPAGEVAAKETCRKKGVRLTIGEKWNLWDDFCASNHLTVLTRSILTPSHLV